MLTPEQNAEMRRALGEHVDSMVPSSIRHHICPPGPERPIKALYGNHTVDLPVEEIEAKGDTFGEAVMLFASGLKASIKSTTKTIYWHKRPSVVEGQNFIVRARATFSDA